MYTQYIHDLHALATHFDTPLAGFWQRRNRNRVVVDKYPQPLVNAATFHNVCRFTQIGVDYLGENFPY